MNIDWSAKFNALPVDIRAIGCAMEARTRIQQLEMEKNRLKKSYSTSMRIANEGIERNNLWLKRLEAEFPNIPQF